MVASVVVVVGVLVFIVSSVARTYSIVPLQDVKFLALPSLSCESGVLAKCKSRLYSVL